MKPKIINIITDSNIGGAGVLLLYFFQAADLNEYDYSVLLPTGSALIPRLNDIGVRTIELNGIAERSLSVSGIRSFKRVFHTEKPDIIHTHGCLSARIAARISTRCKIVYTRHYSGVSNSKLSGKLNSALADRIIAISHTAGTDLIAGGVAPSKITVMYNGAPPMRTLTSAEKEDVRTGYGIGRDEFVVATLARLEKIKGYEYIIAAANKLTDYPIKFVFAGTGLAESEFKSIAPDTCIFTGFIEDVAMIHGISDIQLNASTVSETSSLSLIEGFSVGIPAIATDVGGNPYLVQDGVNGYIVPVCDSDAIVSAILRMYNHRDAVNEMGAKALEIYAERFTANKLANNIRAIYGELVKC